METLYLTQAVYRDLLAVMSRPGVVRQLNPGISRFGSSSLLAIAVTLLDQEVSFCTLGDAELGRAIAETTYGREAGIETADYIFVPGGDSREQIRHAKRGSLEYPDQGATVVYQVERLAETGEQRDIVLSGPGIKETATPVMDGMSRDELLLLAAINKDYPLGLDALLVDRSNRVMALPRSVTITI